MNKCPADRFCERTGPFRVTAWPGMGYASFAFTTSRGVFPTLAEATNEAGNVVYRKVINVDGHCFDTGTVC